jgi:hypothetical protein
VSERSIIKVEDGKIKYTGKVRLPDGTIRVQPEGGIKFIENKNIKNKKDGGLAEAIEKVKAKEMQGGGEALRGGGKGLGTKTIDINTPSGRRKISQIRKIMPDASRDEIIKFGINAGVLKKAKGGKVPLKMQKGGMAPRRDLGMKAMRRLDDAVDEFIETMEPFKGTVKKGDTLRNVGGKTMVVSRMANPNVRDMIGEEGRMMSDADREMAMRKIGREMAMRNIGARRMEDGGKVPAKFKGFSKLPEDVQEQMNPTLAKKFEKGGPVKMGKGGGVCRGMGAARAGGKFKIR